MKTVGNTLKLPPNCSHPAEPRPALHRHNLHKQCLVEGQVWDGWEREEGWRCTRQGPRPAPSPLQWDLEGNADPKAQKRLDTCFLNQSERHCPIPPSPSSSSSLHPWTLARAAGTEPRGCKVLRTAQVCTLQHLRPGLLGHYPPLYPECEGHHHHVHFLSVLSLT
jgi:hypothetical protein